MEGYLEIFGRKFCGKKGNFGLWRRKFFLGVETLTQRHCSEVPEK